MSLGRLERPASSRSAGRVERPSLRERVALLIADRAMGESQRARRSQLEILPPAPASIVMLGDSITEGGLWEEWFPDHRVVNRGIGGETAPQVLVRLTCLENDPSAVFLLIGTNDLSLRYPVPTIAHNVESIVETAESLAPAARIYVQSVMPRGAKWARKIHRLNGMLRQVADRAGVQYIDLWGALEGKDGALKPEFTEDGLHLTGEGYRAWVEILAPFVAGLTEADRRPR